MGGLGANILDRVVVRVGKCLGPLSTIIDGFDKDNGLPRKSGSHANKSTKHDREKMLARLLEMKLFQTTPGRKHTSFPNFRSNPVRSLKQKKTEEADGTSNEQVTSVTSICLCMLVCLCMLLVLLQQIQQIC